MRPCAGIDDIPTLASEGHYLFTSKWLGTHNSTCKHFTFSSEKEIYYALPFEGIKWVLNKYNYAKVKVDT